MDDQALLERLQLELESPNATRLAHALTALISSGDVVPGYKLPPIRTLAEALGMSPAAVGQSWKVLRTKGIIETKTRGGSVVVGPQRSQRPVRFAQLSHSADDARVDLGRPRPDLALLPDLGAALAEVGLRRAGLNHADPPPITQGLRDAVMTNWPFAADDVVAVHRAIDGMEQTLMALVSRGDAVAVEDPTVPRVLDILDRIGARVISIGWHDDGPDPRELMRALHAGATTFVYQPNGHSPTGCAVTDEWLEQVAPLLRRSDALVVELDLFPLLHPVRKTLGTRMPEATTLVEGYSHSHGPDMQAAVVGGPREVIERVAQQIAYSHRWVSRVLQDTLASLLTSAEASTQVAHAAVEYQRRHALAREWFAARGFALAPQTSAPSLWIPVVDDVAVAKRLAELGIGVLPASVFERRRAPQRHIHLNGAFDFDEQLPHYEQIAYVANDVAELSLAARRARYRSAESAGALGG